MSAAIGTLLSWNGACGPHALFWHETARAARVARVDELGDACRLSLRWPAGIRMASLLPPELSFLRHRRHPPILTQALARLLDGARPWRVLAVDAIDDPALFAASVAVFRPDVIAADAALAIGGDEPLDVAELGCVIRCAAAVRPVVDGWLAEFSERARRRGGRQFYRIDELIVAGVAPPAPDTALPLARIAPGQRATIVLPSRGGRASRLVLHLLHADRRPQADQLRLLVDGLDVEAEENFAGMAARMPELPLSPCHVVEIVPTAVELLLVGVGLEPVP